MQLVILDIEIFSGLLVLLGAIFVALICDFLKGNNEQLRERNVELRTRQEERERLGIFQNPMQWIQALADALRPQTVEAAPVESMASAAMTREAESFSPLRKAPEADAAGIDSDTGPMRRRMYDEMKARSQQTAPSAWANKEELEQLAERAARIRARHETLKTNADRVKQETEAQLLQETTGEAAQTIAPPPLPPAAPAVPAAEPERPRPVVKLVGSSAMMPVYTPESASPVPESLLSFDQNKPGFRSSVSLPTYASLSAYDPAEAKTAVETVLESPAAAAPAAPKEESSSEIAKLKVLPIDRSAPDRYEGPVEAEQLDLQEEIQRVAEIALTEARDAAEREATAAAPAAAPAIEPVAPAEPVADPEPPAFLRAAPARVTAIAPSPMSEATPPPAPAAAPEPVQEAVASAPEVPASASKMVPALAAAIQEATAREMAPDPEIPAGLHDAATLRSLIESGMAFAGVAVAIGINDYAGLKEKLAANSGLDSIGALNRMVQSMLRPQDFACQFTDDEFILLYPGESGPSAQRRLFQVSEKLWDFQLRSLGHLSVMFSWGGLEVQNERLTEAVASARERMYQTRRNRKANPLEAGSGNRRRVANG